mmetsp:Transcript_14797/g.51897  ORF Transcript_14797/g.51897 Transcript_14797/m.51897 type:complete len:200 (-) Transcript_14797:313-912(-)
MNDVRVNTASLIKHGSSIGHPAMSMTALAGKAQDIPPQGHNKRNHKLIRTQSDLDCDWQTNPSSSAVELLALLTRMRERINSNFRAGGKNSWVPCSAQDPSTRTANCGGCGGVLCRGPMWILMLFVKRLLDMIVRFESKSASACKPEPKRELHCIDTVVIARPELSAILGATGLSNCRGIRGPDEFISDGSLGHVAESL